MTRLVVLALLVLGLSACGGGSEPDAAPATTASEPATTAAATTTEAEAETESAEETETTKKPKKKRKAEALAGLPRFTAGYDSWPEIASDLPPRDADPHLGEKNVFANREPSGGAFPDGTIIVKEAVRPGADFIGLIATMRKIQGADPEHADWVFIEYTRESASAAFAVQAQDEVCWSCHVGAAKTDYVFVLGDSLP